MSTQDEKMLMLAMLRDLLWELRVAHEKGEIRLNEHWLRIIVATHLTLDEYDEEA